MNQAIDRITPSKFVSRYMGMKESAFAHQQGAIQVHPFSSTASFINAPTPLFRVEYSFLLLFLKGGGIQQVDNDIIQLKPFDSLFIREGHINAIKEVDTKSDGFFICIMDSSLPKIFENKSILNRFTFNPKRTVSKIEMEWICKCCELLHQQKSSTQYSLSIKELLLKSIIMKLAESSHEFTSKIDYQTEVVMLFKELLYENFKKFKDVKFYAESLSLTENSLYRYVKKVNNKSPKQCINEFVVFYSQIMLQDFSKDISQIAYELGFIDPAYFARIFKQTTKLSPSEYRSALLQDLSKRKQD